MENLKQKTVQGGVARLTAQGINFLVRLVSLMILARLLGPRDYGLVGMVTAFTGILSLFRDFGLSAAAVQRATITEEQMSTLFWINVVVGVFLAVLTVAMAPVVAAFYREPRLFAVTAVMALGFLFNAAGVQHSAVLQRHMRFTALAVINTLSLVVATGIAIGGAMAGYGYWALVAMTVAVPLISTVGLWMSTSWIPGMPHRRIGIRSMIHFGGTLTLNGLIVYIATNAEKILLGRFWGIDAVGLYGRAYQLINIPTDNLNSAAGEVAFSALSRLQHDPIRLRSYFRKGYSLILALTVPSTIACALFADDLIAVVLGPQWKAAGPIFRLLAPTILVFAVANPVSWLLTSIGRVGRLLRMGLVIAPIMILSYFLGLPYGPTGVAFAYSAVMLLWLVPLLLWALHGTPVTPRDMLLALSRPLISSLVAGCLAYAARMFFGQFLPPLSRFALEGCVLVVVYLGILLFVAGESSFYLDLLRTLRGSSSAAEESPVSA